MRLPWFALVGVAVLTLAGGPAAGAPLAPGGASAAEVDAVLRADGFATELKTDSDGDPVVFAEHAGAKFGVFFYECRNGRCASIQFSGAFASTQAAAKAAAKAAEWNRVRRFGRAYVGTDGGLRVEMDVELGQGGSTEGIASNLARWKAVLTEFISFAR